MARRVSDPRGRRTNRSKKTERIPTKDALASMIKACSLKTRAAVLLLATSGIRVGELVRLTLSDLDLSQYPPTIRVRNAIHPRKWRISFITGEAKRAVQSYLDQRADRGEELSADSPVFAYESGSSMTPQAMVSMIRRAFESAGVRGQRMRLESQVLRRWFKRQLIGAGTPKKIVDFLVGHSRHSRPPEDEVKRWYAKAIPLLTLSHPAA